MPGQTIASGVPSTRKILYSCPICAGYGQGLTSGSTTSCKFYCQYHSRIHLDQMGMLRHDNLHGRRPSLPASKSRSMAGGAA